MYNKVIDKIKQLISIADEEKEQYSIYFSVNVENLTKINNDYTESLGLSEFLSLNELDEILKSSNRFGFYSKVFFEANEFFKDILHREKNENIIVFEFTQKGSGMAKDSLIPSFCELNNIMYTGSNPLTNALCLDKFILYKLMNSINIPTPESYLYTKARSWLFQESPTCFQNLISKPISMYASIGVEKLSKIGSKQELEEVLNANIDKYKQEFIVQEFISGREVEVPFLVNNTDIILLPPVGVKIQNKEFLDDEFLDFEKVEKDNYDFYILKNDELIGKINEDVKKIIKILRFTGYGRIDLRIDDNNNYFFTDINAYPHIIEHSSFSKSLYHLGFNKFDTVPIIIGNSIYNFNNPTKFEDR